MASPAVIRPCRPRDAQAVREICIEAGWRGRPAWQFLENPELWADLWTDYYLVREPDNCFVAADPAGRPVGYLTGCRDSQAAERFQAQRVLPKLAARALACAHWLRPMNRRFFVRTLRAMRRGELTAPSVLLGQYPGHFHFNLLDPWRGQGIGGRLYDLFERRMRQLGVAGLHSHVLGANAIVNTFHVRRGFVPVARRRLPSLEGYLESGAVELITYVKQLS